VDKTKKAFEMNILLYAILQFRMIYQNLRWLQFMVQ